MQIFLQDMLERGTVFSPMSNMCLIGLISATRFWQIRTKIYLCILYVKIVLIPTLESSLENCVDPYFG